MVNLWRLEKILEGSLQELEEFLELSLGEFLEKLQEESMRNILDILV